MQPPPADSCLVDTHVHLDAEAYAPDRPALLERARAAGVVAFVAPATHLDSSRTLLGLAAEDPRVLPAVGVHPHEASGAPPDLARQLSSLATGAVALGETGLDYHYDLSPGEAQRLNLRIHLESARELGLPVILHCREAEEDLLQELRRIGPLPAGGVVHCFTGGWEWGQRFLDLGLCLGVTGMVTFPKLTQVHEVARRCPRERLLVETDGPYLAPVPFRGRRSEPAHVVRVVEEIARLRGEDPLETARSSLAAARALFGPRVPAPPPR